MGLHIHSKGALSRFHEDSEDSSSLFAVLSSSFMKEHMQLLLQCTQYAKKNKISLWSAILDHQNDILKISEDTNVLSLFGEEELVPEKKIMGKIVENIKTLTPHESSHFTLPVVQPSARLSYSALRTYHQCGLQYYLKYGIQIPDRPGKKAIFGICIHTVLEKIYAYYKETQIFPSEQRIESILSNVLQTAKDIDESQMRTMIKQYIAVYADRFPPSVFVEKGFMVELAGVYFGGFIDLIVKHSYDVFEVVDYKSGRPQTKEQLWENTGARIQIVLYAYAVQKLFGILPRTVSYLYLADQTIVSFDIHAEDIAWLKTFVAKQVSRIQQQDFEPCIGRHCEYCSYKDICAAYDAT